MEYQFATSLFFVLVTALIGGFTIRLFRLPMLIGYILAGVIAAALFPVSSHIQSLAEIGIILLLFSVGLELSFHKLVKVGSVSIAGALLQIVFVSLLTFFGLAIFGFDAKTAIVFSVAFSLSSTALVVKILSDYAETDTIHGQLMIGWLLTQDLVVIPVVVLLPLLSSGGEATQSILMSLISAVALIFVVIFLGRFIVPQVTKYLATTNSKEILLLGGLSIALGMASISAFLGISASLGAFLAGLVISESQENHAIFSETRPLRDLFVILFFVSLGLLVNPIIVYENFVFIIFLTTLLLVVKFATVFVITFLFGYHGKTALISALGLTQVGEFAFVIFISAKNLNIITSEDLAIGTAVVLLSIISTPLLYKLAVPLWRRLRPLKLFFGWNKSSVVESPLFKNHIIICGFGRVGSWVASGLEKANIDFVAIDFNQAQVKKARASAVNIIYGDPTEKDVLHMANITFAKAVVIALPDKIAQQEIISHVQTISPQIKIYARASENSDINKLKQLKITKVVQPEFEASITILKSIFLNLGKNKAEITDRLQSLRKSHSLTI